ncbi:MAG: alginate lyase family protein [Luteolibacter sp.]
MIKFWSSIALLTALMLQSVAADFVHPGVVHTKADFILIRKNVAENKEPWKSGFKRLKADRYSSANYRVQGGYREFGRKPTIRNREAIADASAAYQNAIMWVITGERKHSAKAIEILNAWSSKLEVISGRDQILAAGISGIKFVAAAEILRHTRSGWKKDDVARAERMFLDVFYPVIKDFATFANGNWDAACVQTMMAIGVFTNDQEIFQRAVDWYHSGKGNARLTHYILNEEGQSQESGRDQQHTQLGLGYLAVCAQIGWCQGLDLYGANDNRLLKGFEYTAKYNQGENVPFERTIDVTGKYRHKSISREGRGDLRPIYEMVYQHYIREKGFDAPWTGKAAEKLRPEGSIRNLDHLGFGTLLFSR